jgi:predicted O-methyltransferase YrrM
MTINMHQATHFIKHFFTAKRNGHGIHSPFAYQLCEEVFYNHNSFYDLEALKKIREQLLSNEQTLSIEDFGAGSKTFTGNIRKIKDIAARGISTRLQSETLYKLINFLNCSTCIELGTSIGLNTLYLAKGNANGTVISIEGSKSLADFAQALAKNNNVTNVQYVTAQFNEALPALLNKIPTLDLLYADGNHTYEATREYFNAALKKKHNNSVFIFDDIYWSKGMTKAWQEIKQHPDITLSIDAFYFGMVFFKQEIKEKVQLKFYLNA